MVRGGRTWASVFLSLAMLLVLTTTALARPEYVGQAKSPSVSTSTVTPPDGSVDSAAVRTETRSAASAETRGHPLSVRSWIVVETVKDSLRFEVILHVMNRGSQPISSERLELILPEKIGRFLAPNGDERPLLERQGSRVVLTGPISPGLSQASFVAELPVDGRGEVGFRLGMMAGTEEVQIGFLGPRSATLEAVGFPRLRPSRLPNGVSILATGRTYVEQLRPVVVEAVVSGLPEKGALPWLGLAFSFLLVVLAVARQVMARHRAVVPPRQIEEELLSARECLLDEVCRVEQARQAGRIGPETARSTREELVLALLRIERRLESAQGPVQSEATRPAAQ